MKTFCLLVALASTTITYSQKREEYFDYNWKPCDPEKARYYSVIEKKDGLWARADYYLRERWTQMTGTYLDEQTKVAEGKFAYYFPNKQLQSTGVFKNGKRDGIWFWFHENGMMEDSSYYKDGLLVGTHLSWYADGMPSDSTFLNEDGTGIKVSWLQNGNPSEAGLYSAGVKPNGKWKFYHGNGNVSSIELYDKGKLIDKQYFDENGQPQDTASRDREAKPVSADEWKKYLQNTAYFPHHLKFTNNGEATVLVRFAVDERGNVVEPYITYSLHPDFDKIVYDAIKKAPKWLPAINHNRAVKTYHTQPIMFAQTE